MTEQEAVERLKYMRLFMQINDDSNDSKFLEDDYIANDMAIKALEEIQQYRALGTVEKLRVARDKQIPKKVIPRHIRKYDGFDDGECPTCGNSVLRDGFSNDVYCDECGQKLDWSDEDENNG